VCIDAAQWKQLTDRAVVEMANTFECLKSLRDVEVDLSQGFLEEKVVTVESVGHMARLLNGLKSLNSSNSSNCMNILNSSNSINILNSSNSLNSLKLDLSGWSCFEVETVETMTGHLVGCSELSLVDIKLAQSVVRIDVSGVQM
jgi:hypothetical protein